MITTGSHGVVSIYEKCVKNPAHTLRFEPDISWMKDYRNWTVLSTTAHIKKSDCRSKVRRVYEWGWRNTAWKTGNKHQSLNIEGRQTQDTAGPRTSRFAGRRDTDFSNPGNSWWAVVDYFRRRLEIQTQSTKVLAVVSRDEQGCVSTERTLVSCRGFSPVF